MLVPSIILIALPLLVTAANIPPLWPGWSYSGCMYEGRNNRLLGQVVQTSSAMSIRICVETCAMRNMPYAGLENGDQCFCGSGLSFSQPASEVQCRSPCSGAPDEMCGGVEYMTVLSKAPDAPSVASPGAPGESSQVVLPSNVQSSTIAPTSSSVPEAPSNVASSISDSPSSSSSSGTVSASSSAESSSAPQISQYLSVPSTSASTSSDTSRSAIISHSPFPTSTSRPSTTSKIWTNHSIFRLAPGVTGQSRLKDQSNMIVFGTYVQSNSVERVQRGMGLLGTMLVLCLVMFLL